MSKPLKHVLVLLCVLFSHDLLADCRLNLTLPKEIKIESQGITQSSLMIGNGGTSSCTFFIGFSEGEKRGERRQLSDGQDLQSYEIYSDAGKSHILRDAPEASAEQVLSGTISSSQKFSTIPFFVEVPTEVLNRAGFYSDLLEVTIYEGTPSGQHQVLQRKNLRLIYEVPQEVMLSLVEPGSPFTPNDVDQVLDFGILESGKTKSFDVVIKANTDFDLFFLSENKGRMKHAKRQDFVDYKFHLNGSQYHLSSETKTSQGFDQSSKGFYRNEVRIIIGDVQNHSSGHYEDNITVTVVAR